MTESPLHLASESRLGQVDTARMLIEYVDLTAQNDDGFMSSINSIGGRWMVFLFAQRREKIAMVTVRGSTMINNP
jgi:hypothetical protein